MTRISLEDYRQQFPSLSNKAYFNFGGQGTLPRPALEAIYRAYEYLQERGPFSTEVNAWISKQTQLTREAIATELGAPPDTITLTENVTFGCNIPLWGIDWQAGDRILMTDCEHPGVIAAVREISRRFQVEVAICPILATLNQGDPTAIIERYLTPNTRLLVLSHLLWNTGQVLPLPEIIACCRQTKSHKPIQVLVDAAQSAGSLALNLTELGADFYAFTGHKWLCGPAGVGGLYVRPEALETLSPAFIGWRGVVMDEAGNPIAQKPGGARFEVATSAFPQYVGLQHAIATHRTWGTSEERYQQICQNSAFLWQKLAETDGVNCLRSAPPQAGLVSFKLTGGISHKQAVMQLEQQGFLLRTILDPDCIRACVHYFSDRAEIDRLVDAIAQL
ncbi:aminotransferase class V-fold PLP-dependent enzyme [Oscillatoria sp. FACHB-1406]|uniref:aminotransferase class V-fold PLP-dependent enzyme n=1 Tax=Oscillatoria sp. FACHB-1406 TaxID=2692846 RepID=UPI0016879997|nr:aminotransferase class V-fold PLP-dependent enzyme [Oscillatoria sp. FACHB-1406]MBD2578944.1 aminotransferase class V-fold PLP-dependent enzyme [Oscillatoria sp. FACHB-1406]